MPKFVKKPIEIEARFYGTNDGRELAKWCGGEWHDPYNDADYIVIQTLEGKMAATPGDWIIKGIKGEFYPCRPDIFEATYTPIEPEALFPCGHPAWMEVILVDTQQRACGVCHKPV
jgi:hypothetical protein